MKRKAVLSLAGLLLVVGIASAGDQCDKAMEFGWLSPAQNTACVYEWLFELAGGWTL